MWTEDLSKSNPSKSLPPQKPFPEDKVCPVVPCYSCSLTHSFIHSLIHSFTHSFIQQIFIESLLCLGLHSRNTTDRNLCPHGTQSLAGTSNSKEVGCTRRPPLLILQVSGEWLVQGALPEHSSTLSHTGMGLSLSCPVSLRLLCQAEPAVTRIIPSVFPPQGLCICCSPCS